MWTCAWASCSTLYMLNTDMIVWAPGKVGLCQSSSGFILLSHYTKWYYVDRDKCLRRLCSKMTLFQGKFNLESWTHFCTTEHIFSPINAFHSHSGIHHAICYVYHIDYQKLTVMLVWRGSVPFMHIYSTLYLCTFKALSFYKLYYLQSINFMKI